MTALDVVIMAAGKGTRMKSGLPKVLHRLGGRALLAHVIDCAAGLQPRRVIVITGHGAEQVEGAARDFAKATGLAACDTVLQEPQLGTGHAVQQALPLLPQDGTCLVLNGDVPLIEPSTLQALLQACAGERLALLTVDMPDPTGYGRIVREGESVRAIVEHKDASEAQRRITEVYTGFMAAPNRLMRSWLSRLRADNAQGEYYLTDVIGMAVEDGHSVAPLVAATESEVLGVNDRLQLAQLEAVYRRQCVDEAMRAGARLADPARFDQRGTLLLGRDVFIDVNVVFEGRVALGDRVHIGPNCVLRDCRIDREVRVQANCVIEEASVGAGSIIGPFARLRPGAALAGEVHIGNFVEVKNSSMAVGSKANHLAYVGDATVGARVNIGAGTIIANYDGANKHHTTIGDDAHTGSNSVLVAPITVGEGATIGAGSTVTRSVPPGKLTVARAKQMTLDGWKRPIKVRKP